MSSTESGKDGYLEESDRETMEQVARAEDRDFENRNSEDRNSEPRVSEVKGSETRNSEAKGSEDRVSEDRDSEDRDSDDTDSEDRESEDGESEDRESEDRGSEDRVSEDRDSEEGDSEHGDSEDNDEILEAVSNSSESDIEYYNFMVVDTGNEANPDTSELETISNSSQRSEEYWNDVIEAQSNENDAENGTNGIVKPVKKHETISFKRLMKELKNIIEYPPPFCTAGIRDNNLYTWQATIIGPPDTAYEGGIFTLHLDFSPNYPFQPPRVKFQNKIYHCNISSKGNICLDILSSNWSPALSVSTLLMSICSLLSTCNPKDPLVPRIAELYRNNREEHDRRAREYTKRYAS